MEPKRAYAVDVAFYLSSHTKDIDNLTKTVLDGLQRIGGWNDRQVKSLSASVASVRDGGKEQTVLVVRDVGELG